MNPSSPTPSPPPGHETKTWRVGFRVDAALHIGTGHVMRCLTLADALRSQGAECSFVCRPHPGHLLALIEQRGHRALALPTLGTTPTAQAHSQSAPPHAAWLGTHWAEDAADTQRALTGAQLDWLVVDHYALDAQWEQAMQTASHRTMVIDDLADRPHHCHLLLDQNLGRTEAHYRAAQTTAHTAGKPAGHIAASTRALIGPQYALLRPEFAHMRPASLARRTQPQLKQLLITMGGVDQNNATGQVLDALATCQMPAGLEITVIMGTHAPWLPQIKTRAQRMPWPTQVLTSVNNMAQLMADSDLAIGAAGSTAWERCCLGLPTIQLALAQNQEGIALALEQQGAALKVNSQAIYTDLLHCLKEISESHRLAQISDSAKNVTNGTGVGKTIRAMESIQ